MSALWESNVIIQQFLRTPLYDLETATPLALVGRVGSLVVDWVHHHLYWTDLDQGGRLEAALLDGTGRRVVHRVENGTNLGAMVVDPLLGYGSLKENIVSKLQMLYIWMNIVMLFRKYWCRRSVCNESVFIVWQLCTIRLEVLKTIT